MSADRRLVAVALGGAIFGALFAAHLVYGGDKQIPLGSRVLVRPDAFNASPSFTEPMSQIVYRTIPPGLDAVTALIVSIDRQSADGIYGGVVIGYDAEHLGADGLPDLASRVWLGAQDYTPTPPLARRDVLQTLEPT